jgi:threonine dehydratase
MYELKTLPLTRQSVIEAFEIIKPHVHETPLLTNRTISSLASTPQSEQALSITEWAGSEPAHPKIRLFFKCENLQRIGAFKARGAFHAIERLRQDKDWLAVGGPEKGVITHSSGKDCIIIL